MRMLLVIGVLCDVVGIALVLVGLGVLPLGTMSGQMIWAFIGSVIMLGGGLSMILGLKRIADRND